jgi:hypothetical protein
MSYRSWLFVPVITGLCVLTLGFQTKTAKGGVYFHGLKGETLVDACKAVERMDTTTYRVPKDDLDNVATCIGFVVGVIDGETFNDVGEDGQPTHRHHYCVPDDATSTQLAKIVAKYGRDHPEELSDPGVSLVIFAMKRAFPCG